VHHQRRLIPLKVDKVLSDFTGQGKESDRAFILATIEQLASHLGSK